MRFDFDESREQIVRGHARNYRLDPALVAAVIYQESKFRADAKSSSGAIGLMQLLPGTAEGIAVHNGHKVVGQSFDAQSDPYIGSATRARMDSMLTMAPPPLAARIGAKARHMDKGPK